MNKKKLMYALSFGLVTFFAAACGNKTEEGAAATAPVDTVATTSAVSAPVEYMTESKNNDKAILKSGDISVESFSLVKARIRILSVCAGPYCSDVNNYCGNDTCLKKIKDCHTISDSLFNALTSNGANGFATFNASNIAPLLRADCRKYIRLTSAPTSMSIDTASAVDTTLANTAFYTVALWQEIARTPMKTVQIHKAVYDASTSRYLVPFKVSFSNGTVQAYDVSSDLP